MSTKVMTKAAFKAEVRQAAIDTLRGYVAPGDTLYTILKHVSASGMSRAIAVVVIADGKPFDVTHLASKIMDAPIHAKHYGVTVGGCGMDMGYHVVYSLSRALWPDGQPCTGNDLDPRHRCPSNDHSNGDRDYTPGHLHSDGGYALRHWWL